MPRAHSDTRPGDNGDERESLGASFSGAPAAPNSNPGWLCEVELAEARRRLPMLYVEALPVRTDGMGAVTQVGILLRATPLGEMTAPSSRAASATARRSATHSSATSRTTSDRWRSRCSRLADHPSRSPSTTLSPGSAFLHDRPPARRGARLRRPRHGARAKPRQDALEVTWLSPEEAASDALSMRWRAARGTPHPSGARLGRRPALTPGPGSRAGSLPVSEALPRVEACRILPWNPLTLPRDLDGWRAFAEDPSDRAPRARGEIDARLTAESDLPLRERLALWNEAEIALSEAAAPSHLVSRVAPRRRGARRRREAGAGGRRRAVAPVARPCAVGRLRRCRARRRTRRRRAAPARQDPARTSVAAVARPRRRRPRARARNSPTATPSSR